MTTQAKPRCCDIILHTARECRKWVTAGSLTKLKRCPRHRNGGLAIYWFSYWTSWVQWGSSFQSKTSRKWKFIWFSEAIQKQHIKLPNYFYPFIWILLIVQCLSFRPHSDRYNAWLKPPVQPYLSAYAFNVTNPDQVRILTFIFRIRVRRNFI